MLYQMMVSSDISVAGGVLPPRHKRLERAYEAFAQVIAQLPSDDPFGKELMRYHDEVMVPSIGEGGDSAPKWDN